MGKNCDRDQENLPAANTGQACIMEVFGPRVKRRRQGAPRRPRLQAGSS